ncbi:putative xanthine dehydrogenase subunit D [archaeon HR01]|nr:putative xanthine dehydrogenase subunit D [archaeon HR01]
MTLEYRWVGKPLARRDAYEKASGAAVYSSDLFPENALYVVAVRSGLPHARIKSIDVSEALKHHGVVAVYTHRDIPNNRYGVFVKDRPVLCDDRVRYVGDPVALVAAETREEAEEAAPLVRVDYEPLPAVTDPLKAMGEDSPRIHEGGNICRRTRITYGDVETSFSKADVVVENTYTTAAQIHAYLETEAGISYIDERGRITVVAGGQSPYRDREEICHTLGLPREKVRVITPHVGGAFGGKDEITVQIHLALVTLKTGRPARMVWSREESNIAGVKRHPSIVRMKTAASADGVLLANQTEIIFDTGAYASLGPAVLDVAIENCNGPYRIPNIDIKATLVYTNNMVASAFRGFGSPQVIFAIESQMDQLAERLGLDPLEIRLKNVVRKGDYGVFRNKLEGSVGIDKCLESLRNHPLWRRRGEYKGVQNHEWIRRGVGVAAAVKGYTLGALPDRGSVALELNADGGFTVRASSTEIGQGIIQSLTQLAADLLACSPEKVRVILADTGETPDTSVTSASRQLFLSGNALRIAAEKMLDLMRDVLAKATGDPKTSFRFSDGHAHTMKGEAIPYSAIHSMMAEGGVATYVEGVYEVPRTTPIPGSLEIPHLFYMYGATLALVEVNLLTGFVSVLRVVSAVDAGRVVNRQTFTGQVEGAVAQGIGYALMENPVIENGMMRTLNFSTYLIPSIKDVPEIEVVAVEDGEESGPFGAKGVGEIGIVSVAPAIANALYDAVGVRMLSIPMTPEKVYWLIKHRR